MANGEAKAFGPRDEVLRQGRASGRAAASPTDRRPVQARRDGDPMHQKTWRSMRRSLIGGTAVASLLAFGIGGWAATTEVAGAVIAPGSLVVDSNVKKVQHPTGGVVGELRVRDGDRGQGRRHPGPLGRDRHTRANLAVITKSMDELAARQARLKAEQDGREVVSFPSESGRAQDRAGRSRPAE